MAFAPGDLLPFLEYDLVLDGIQRPAHDANTADGRDVQIKATFKEQLMIRAVPDYYPGFKLHTTGEYEEIYNGPGLPIAERYSHRKGFGVALLSFPVAELRKLSAMVPRNQRIARREV